MNLFEFYFITIRVKFYYTLFYYSFTQFRIKFKMILIQILDKSFEKKPLNHVVFLHSPLQKTRPSHIFLSKPAFNTA